MIESSYKPINGEASSSHQPWHRNVLHKIKNTDRSFIISKLFYFCFYTALGALFPFFSLYYRQLWLSPSQIGLLVSLRPAVKVICLPLWKVVTDSYSRPRAVYFISIFGWLIGYYGQTLVNPDNLPCYGINTSVPIQQNHTVLSNNSALNASLSDMASREWNHNPGENTYNFFNKKTLNKRYLASKLSSFTDQDPKLPSQLIGINNVRNINADADSKLDAPTEKTKKMFYASKQTRKTWKNNENKYEDREISAYGEERNDKVMRQAHNDANNQRLETESEQKPDRVEKRSVKLLSKIDEKTENKQNFVSDVGEKNVKILSQNDNNDINHQEKPENKQNFVTEKNVKIPIQNENADINNRGEHTKSELVSRQIIMRQEPDDYTDKLFSPQTQKSPKPANDVRVKYNYWIVRVLAVIIILTEIITSPTPMLADSAVMQSLADTDNDYGKQRLFGILGLALSAFLVAVWVSNSTNCLYSDTIDYLPCFKIFFIAIFATVLVSLFFKFEAPERGEGGYKLLKAIQVFKAPRYGFFLFTMFMLGYAHSLQITFLFWFLQDIGGSPALFAFIILVYCISEVVMYFVLGYIIQAIGLQRTLVIGIACYVVRFLMYGSLQHPWLVLPMELVQGMTYGGVWMVAGMYINSTEDTAKTVQSILHGIYWGVGMAVGALVSGLVIEAYGAKIQFLVTSLVMAILCIVHLFIFLVDRIQELEKESRTIRRQQPITTQPTIKKNKGTDQSNEYIVGAAAAPLVPCLLYGQ